MAIRKVVDKRGRTLYIGPKGFTTASKYVKEYFNVTGRGSSFIFPLADLSAQELKIYRAQARAAKSYRYNGRFVSREVAQALKDMGYSPGKDVKYNPRRRGTRRGLKPGEFEVLKKEVNHFYKDSLLKNGKYYITVRGDEMRTANALLNAYRKGDIVNVIIGEEIFQGMDAIRELMNWENAKYSESGVKTEVVRISHRIHYDRKKGVLELDVKDSQIDLFGSTP